MRDGKQMCQDFEDFIRQRYVVGITGIYVIFKSQISNSACRSLLNLSWGFFKLLTINAICTVTLYPGQMQRKSMARL